MRRLCLCLLLTITASTAWAQPAIDVEMLMEDVSVLAADSLEGRRAGTEGNARARAYLEQAFRDRGVQALDEDYAYPFSFEARGDRTVEGVNLVGQVKGTSASDAVLVVTAHYDHLGVRDGEVFNGADDNASGVAALLALADVLRRQPPDHTVILIALDAEEMGLHGARAFVADPPIERSRIALNVNLDMVSRSAAGELYAAGTHHYPFLRPFVEAAAERSTIQVRFGHDEPGEEAGHDWTTASDHGAFHRAGIPFLYFGVEDHPDYHRPTDDATSIDPAFFGASARTIIDAILTFDANLEAIIEAAGR